MTSTRLLALSLVLVGCGAEQRGGSPSDPPPDADCLAPDRVVGDRCVPPGVQDDGCAAGTVVQEDGTCLPAGIVEGACVEGFAHDGDLGCLPVLPEEPCADGLMAVPGDATCHPVMDCGDGTWGDIPIDATTIFVDAGYAGATTSGTQAEPFVTVADAVAAAVGGATIAIAAGTYVEDLLLTKPVTLRGVCPEHVALMGTGAGLATLDLRYGASGTQVHGLAITGDNLTSVFVTGAQDIVLSRVWVHDASGQGVTIQDDQGQVSLTLRDSLVERTVGLGVFVGASHLVLDGVVVRDTQPRPLDFSMGRGVVFQPNPTGSSMSTGVVRRCVVERNHDLGLFVGGSEVAIEGSVIRGTLPLPGNASTGGGISVQHDPVTGAPGAAVITGSVVEDNHWMGVFVEGSTAEIAGVVVRGPFRKEGDGGRGLNIQAHPTSGAPSTVSVRGSLLEGSHELAVHVQDSALALEGVVIRDTHPTPDLQFGGRGLNAQSGSQVDAVGVVIERSHALGAFIAGSTFSASGLVIRDTQPSALASGRGLNLQRDSATGEFSTGVLSGSVLERNDDLGVFVGGSSATFSGVVVGETAPTESEGLFGDGILVISVHQPAQAELTGCLVHDSARAGLSNFGATMKLHRTTSSCNDIDLMGEVFEGQPFTYEDAGSNHCGCAEPLGACKAVSVGLAPPEAVDAGP